MDKLTEEEIVYILVIVLVISAFYYLFFHMPCISSNKIDNFNAYQPSYYKMYEHQINCPNGPSYTDTVKLNRELMEKVNSKECAMCTYKENSNNKINYSMYDLMSIDNVEQDNEKVLNNEITLNNINNFATFNNIIEQDSNNVESSVDKIAEIRTCGNETSAFKKYGNKISDIFDNLVSTDAMKYKTSDLPVEGNSDFPADYSEYQQLYSNNQNKQRV